MSSSSDQPLALIVDDTPENLVALEATLRPAGLRLAFARSGAEALKMVLREVPTVILLDVLMPDMDGYEVARHLKQMEATRNVPILFITAMATDMTFIYRAYETGAVDFLIKPLDPEMVRKKVDVFVQLVQQKEQIRRQSEALLEQSRREHDLRMAELRVAGDRRYQKLVDGMHHVVGWTMSSAFRLTFIARRAHRLLGYSPAEMLEPSFWEKTLHPDDREPIMRMFQRALDDGSEHATYHRLVTSDGATLWFHTVVSGERGPRGTELHGVSVDVSDLKEAQEEAERAKTLREQVLAIVAHDLRTPLTAIKLSNEIIQRSNRNGSPLVAKHLATIDRQARRMSGLIDDLLVVAVIRANTIQLSPETVAADGLLRESVEPFALTASGKRLDLAVTAPRQLEVSCDVTQMTRALGNLISNAVKFTPEGGRVSVSAEPRPAGVTITIEDSGPGIPEDELVRFHQSELSARSRPEGGFGLGLIIAKGLVEAHEGQLLVDSQPGRGTRWEVVLPPRSGSVVQTH